MGADVNAKKDNIAACSKRHQLVATAILLGRCGARELCEVYEANPNTCILCRR